MISKDLLKQTPQQWARLNRAEPVHHEAFASSGVELYIKREDLIDANLSGNKLYKLYGHLQAAQKMGCNTLISFGGYYSNHLHALAFLGKKCGYQTVGFVRGHQPTSLTPTLQECQMAGMELQFLSRQEYQKKSDPLWQRDILSSYPGAYLIPEGGQGLAGLMGCEYIQQAVREQLRGHQTTTCIACGTGTTLAGLLRASRAGDSLLGFSALKLGEQKRRYLSDIAAQTGLNNITADWDVIDDYHFGGFAKHTKELIDFIRDFEQQTAIPLDPVYTGKMLYGITQMAAQGFWPEGHKVVAIHSGGLQGRRGKPGLMEI